MRIAESHTQHPIVLALLYKALQRIETRGGNFYDYKDKSIPKGSPLSPLLRASVLIPLDKAIGHIQGVFYARFMGGLVVMAKSKKALRKVIKVTHNVLNGSYLKLYSSKTYIDKINHGFNFLNYYMDDQKILPSKETIRHFLTRSAALYERSPGNRNVSRRKQRNSQRRDISEHHVNKPAPTDLYFKDVLTRLLAMAALKPDTLATLWRYVGGWAWLC